MTSPTLLVLAAGLGSRYGGLKQVEPVGPSGETVLDYAVFDALRAGFARVVFVIRRDIEAALRGRTRHYEAHVDVAYAFQELDDLPPGFDVPAGRTRPWGTAHAVLAAAKALHTPFATVNADDFYGAAPFEVMGEFLEHARDEHALVPFRLATTLSAQGGVARAICQTRDGWLTAIEEVTGIERANGGARAGTRLFGGDEPASLNFWGFSPGILPLLREGFAAFMGSHGRELDQEFYLPVTVNQLIAAGRARVRILEAGGHWFGLTHRGDRQRAVEAIRELVQRGDYPAPLWKP